MLKKGQKREICLQSKMVLKNVLERNNSNCLLNRKQLKRCCREVKYFRRGKTRSKARTQKSTKHVSDIVSPPFGQNQRLI